MIGIIAACTLLLSVGLLCTRRPRTAVLLCAVQALFAAAALALFDKQLAFVAIVAVILNGLALPFVLRHWLDQEELAPRVGAGIALPAALILIAAVATIFAKVGPSDVVACGTSVVLLGLLQIARQSNRMVHVIGLLSAQNGLVLVAGTNPDVPVEAALLAALPLVPAMMLADGRLQR